MQTYSIILGHNSKKSTVDVDLSSLGGGVNISRHHTRIFYDFTSCRFNLEILAGTVASSRGCFTSPAHLRSSSMPKTYSRSTKRSSTSSSLSAASSEEMGLRCIGTTVRQWGQMGKGWFRAIW
ncbi:hypothetical protein RHMOL_Rhmol11G0176100 [Rhododendron molle]|uniref:Uncharacterized protein n=1 Tax=Rhododendron molle TaxID=49168 RepID=A0ACC0LTH3_RHOML|nr:hypothetical protein RHMOL_Rhmol11G0176100 [Rhododendron molle]